MITRVMERIEVPFARKIVLPKVMVEHWCCNWASLLHANGKAESWRKPSTATIPGTWLILGSRHSPFPNKKQF
jgi:hypothetical protein